MAAAVLANNDCGAAIKRLNKSHERIIAWDRDDPREYGRLERRHEIIKSLLNNKLHETPVVNPRRILDCSAGSGCWALEACELYKDARVVAFDRSSLQCVGPLSERIECVQGSLEAALPFPDDYFDLVHAQAIQPQVRNWPAFIRELYRVTKHGGWVYLVESDAGGVHFDGELPPAETAIQQWCQICNEASLFMGLDTSIHLKLPALLQATGFQSVTERVMKAKSQPVQNAPATEQTIAKLILADMLEGVRHFGKDALEVLSYANPELDARRFVSLVQKELKDPSMRWCLEYRGVAAQKNI